MRGRLTRDRLVAQGIDCPEVYGDPALLLPLIYDKPVERHHTIGIVAHYMDEYDEKIKTFLADNPDATLISLTRYGHWRGVVDQIRSCEVVVSSSLHGLIIADAYGVRNAWMELSDKVEDRGFKFRDYFSSVGRDTSAPVDCTTSISREAIERAAALWKPISFDPAPLIKACPFAIKESIVARATAMPHIGNHAANQ